MKKSKGKSIIIIAIITLIIGLGLFIYHRYRITYQNSIKFIDLALTSLERADKYLGMTKLIQTVSYIVLAVSAVEFMIGLLLQKASKRNKTADEVSPAPVTNSLGQQDLPGETVEAKTAQKPMDNPSEIQQEQSPVKSPEQPVVKRQEEQPDKAHSKQQEEQPDKVPAKQQEEQLDKAPVKLQEEQSDKAPAKQQEEITNKALAKQQEEQSDKVSIKPQENQPQGLPIMPVSSPLVNNFCKKCGSRLEPGARFCRKCGDRV